MIHEFYDKNEISKLLKKSILTKRLFTIHEFFAKQQITMLKRLQEMMNKLRVTVIYSV